MRALLITLLGVVVLLPCACLALTGRLWAAITGCNGQPTYLVEDGLPGSCLNLSTPVSAGADLSVSIKVTCTSLSPNGSWSLDGWSQFGCGIGDHHLKALNTFAQHSDECWSGDISGFPLSIKINCAVSNAKPPTIPPPPLTASQLTPSGSASRVYWHCTSNADCCSFSTCAQVPGSPYSACFLNPPYSGLCPRCDVGFSYSNGTCQPSNSTTVASTILQTPLFVTETGTLDPAVISVCYPPASGVSNFNSRLSLQIRWTSYNLIPPSMVTLFLKRTGTSFAHLIVANVTSSGQYDWTPLKDELFFAAQNSTDYYIQILSSSNSSVNATSGSISFQPSPFWKDLPTTQLKPFDVSDAIRPVSSTVIPFQIPTTFNNNFKGSRCRYLYTAEELGLSTGRSVIIKSIRLYVYDAPVLDITRFRIDYYTVHDSLLNDLFLRHPVKNLLTVQYIRKEDLPSRSFVTFTFDHPLKVSFPDSLVLEMSHVLSANARPVGAWCREGSLFFVPVTSLRSACAGTDDWTATTPFPYPITTNDGQIRQYVPYVEFEVVAFEDELIPSTCGSITSFQASTTDNTWKRLSGTGINSIDCSDPRQPFCRTGSSLVYYQGFAVIFGGRGQFEGRAEIYNDAWALSLNTSSPKKEWVQLFRTDCTSTSMPSCRVFHSATRVKDDMYIFGGTNAQGVTVKPNQVFWRFDLKKMLQKLNGTLPKNDTLWERITTLNPRSSFRQAMTSDLIENIYVFGGSDEISNGLIANSDQLFGYNVKSRTWTDFTSSAHCCSAGVTCPTNSLNACVVNTTASVSLFKCYSSSCTSGHTMVLFNSTLYVFGGTRSQIDPPRPTNTLISFDLRSPSQGWKTINDEDCNALSRPACRRLHSAALRNEEMLVYGGRTSRNTSFPANDLWAYNIVDGTWRLQSLSLCDERDGMPPCSSDHSIVVVSDEVPVQLNSSTNMTTVMVNHTASNGTKTQPMSAVPPLLLFGGQNTAPGSTQFLNGVWMQLVTPLIIPSMHSSVMSITTPTEETRLVLTGVNIDSKSNLSVVLGGMPCTNLTIEATGTAVSCRIPSGAGFNVKAQMIDTVLGVPFASQGVASVSYPRPVPTTVVDFGSVHTTLGGYVIQVQGLYFGPEGQLTPPKVLIGEKACLQTTYVSDEALNCTVPAGVGVVDVRVVVGHQESQEIQSGTFVSAKFAYVRPVVTGVLYSSAPTLGGTKVTVSGTEFGNKRDGATVEVNLRPCKSTQYIDETTLVCVLPEGIGANVPVQIRAGGQLSSPSPSSRLSYDTPIITNISFGTDAPTQGGTLLTVEGTNLGFPSMNNEENVRFSVLVNNQSCTETMFLKSTNTTQILTCKVPPGLGASPSVTVDSLGGVSAPYSASSVGFSYQAPVVKSTSPSVITIDVDSRVEVRGDNFGDVQEAISVKINGRPCTALVLLIPHALVSCAVPSLSEQATADLVVSVAQSDSNTYPVVVQFQPVPDNLRYTMQALAVGGLLLSAILFGLIIKYRTHDLLRASSVPFLLIFVFGGAISISSVFFFHENVDPWCHVGSWLVNIGFTLLVGSVVLKNWRLLNLFNNDRLTVSSNRFRTNSFLYGVLGGMVLFDVLALGAYTTVSECNVPDYESLDTLVIISTLFVEKASILIAGVSVALQSRIIYARKFQERIQLGYCIYTVCLSSLFALPVLLMVNGQPEAEYMFKSLILTAVPVATMLIFLGPKFHAIFYPEKDVKHKRPRQLGDKSTDTPQHSNIVLDKPYGSSTRRPKHIPKTSSESDVEPIRASFSINPLHTPATTPQLKQPRLLVPPRTGSDALSSGSEDTRESGLSSVLDNTSCVFEEHDGHSFQSTSPLTGANGSSPRESAQGAIEMQAQSESVRLQVAATPCENSSDEEGRKPT